VSLKMDRTEYRAVIKFFVKECLTPNEIHSKFITVYGDSSPSFSTIKKWAADFKRGRTSLEDDPKIKLILCVDLLLWMRLGFTITHQNQNSSQNSGQKPVVQRQRRQGRFHQQERSWHRCFGMLKAIFIDYLEKGKKKTTGEYYYNLLTRLDEKNREKRPGLQRKKSSFIRTMHPPTKLF